MQDFGQYPYGPLDDPLYEPLDPFEDPFETMLNAAFGPGPTGDFGLFDSFAAMNLQGPRIGEGEDRDSLGSLLGDAEADIEGTPSIRSEADDVSKTLGQLEDNIEKSPPIRSGPDDTGKMLGRLEKDIENTSIPPEPKIDMELFEDPGWGRTTPSNPYNTSPPPGIYDNPSTRSTRSLPHIPNRRIAGKHGSSKHNDSSDEEIWCPLENDFISPQVCKDCEYYDSDAEVCVYGSKEETDSDNQDGETNE